MQFKYCAEIDGLRALSILLVLFFHVGFESFSGGFVGVDVFFVISGYLITRMIVAQVDQNAFSFKDFYLRRFRRLFPALLVTVFIVFIVAALFLSVKHFSELAESSIAAVFSLSNFYFWSLSGYFETYAIYKPLLHTWSLSIEEQFYIFWPVILVFLYKAVQEKLFLAIFFIGCLSLAYSEKTISVDNTASFFFTISRVFEFCIGGVLVWVKDNYCSEEKSSSLFFDFVFLMGLALILYAGLVFDEESRFPGVNALIPCLGAFLIISSLDVSRLAVVLKNGALVRLGKLSYSLYLVHWPVIVFYRYIFELELDFIDRVIMILISITLAYFLSKFVENRFRSSLATYIPVIGASGKTIMLMVLLCVSLLSVSVTQDGCKWRLVELPSYSGPTISVNTICDNGFGLCDKNLNDATHLLVGDSHSYRAKEFFGPFFVEENIKGYFIKERNSCYPIFIRGKAEGACDHHRKKIEALIIDSQADVVILSGMWMYSHLQSNTNDNESASKLLSDLKYTADVINRSGKKIVIFGQPPEFYFDTSACFNRPNLFSLNSCDIRDSGHRLDKQLHLSNSFNILAKENRDISYIDNIKDMCQGSMCRAGFGVPFYTDEHHLSRIGARYILQTKNKNLLREKLFLENETK